MSFCTLNFTHRKVRWTEKGAGGAADAIEAHGAAIDLQRTLVNDYVRRRLESDGEYQTIEYPNTGIEYFDFQSDLADSYYYRSLAEIDAGRTEAAGRDLRAAVDLLGQMVASYPGDVRFTWRLARAQTALGALQGDSRLLSDAEETLNGIASLSWEYSESRAANKAARGELLIRTGELREGKQLLEEALGMQEELVGLHPTKYELKRRQLLMIGTLEQIDY